MSKKIHHIKLTREERDELTALARKRGTAALKVQRAKALLAADCGEGGPAGTDAEAAASCGLTVRSIERLRVRACEVGPLGALLAKTRERPPVEPKITGDVQARMVQIACSETPEGHDRWTMNMIAGRLIELEVVGSVSGETVRTTLKKTTSNPGSKSAGA